MSEYHPGQVIKKYRKLKGWSQQKLADNWPRTDGETGATWHYVQRVEYGKRNVVAQPVLRKLSALLDIPLSEFGCSEHDPYSEAQDSDDMDCQGEPSDQTSKAKSSTPLDTRQDISPPDTASTTGKKAAEEPGLLREDEEQNSNPQEPPHEDMICGFKELLHQQQVMMQEGLMLDSEAPLEEDEDQAGSLPAQMGAPTPITTRLWLPKANSSDNFTSDQDSATQAYIDANLTAQLLSLASTPESSPDEVQHELEQRLEAFRQSNPDKEVEQIRRNTLPVVAMNPLTSHINVNISRIPEVALNQYAAGITACDYLSNGSLEDRQLATSMSRAYIPVLQTVISEMPHYRKRAAGLLSQTWQIKSRMSFHFQSIEQAIWEGEEAIKYGRESGNWTMLAMVLRRLFALCEYGIVEDLERRKQASPLIEEARFLVERKTEPAIPAFIRSWVYTGSSKYEALCKMEDEMLLSIGKAEETFAASLDDKESRIPRNVSYSYSCAHLYRHKAISYAYLGKQGQAFEIFKEKLINIDDTFMSRLPMITSNRLGILSEFTFTTLYVPKTLKDKELSIKLWRTHLEETKAWRSESNFNEARIAYLVMKGIWSGDSDVEELNDLLVHWSVAKEHKG